MTAATFNDFDPARRKALSKIRGRVREHVTEAGIYLRASFRYEYAARDLAALVEAVGGDVDVRKVGKMRSLPGNRCTRPWKVEFTVGIVEDLYIARGVRL